MLRNVAIMPWSEPVLMTLGTCNAVQNSSNPIDNFLGLVDSAVVYHAADETASSWKSIDSE